MLCHYSSQGAQLSVPLERQADTWAVRLAADVMTKGDAYMVGVQMALHACCLKVNVC